MYCISLPSLFLYLWLLSLPPYLSAHPFCSLCSLILSVSLPNLSMISHTCNLCLCPLIRSVFLPAHFFRLFARSFFASILPQNHPVSLPAYNFCLLSDLSFPVSIFRSLWPLSLRLSAHCLLSAHSFRLSVHSFFPSLCPLSISVSQIKKKRKGRGQRGDIKKYTEERKIEIESIVWLGQRDRQLEIRLSVFSMNS